MPISNHYTIFSTLTALLFCLPQTSFAHGGGLDSSGGHYNRKTGTYHTHRSRSAPPKVESYTPGTRSFSTYPKPHKQPTTYQKQAFTYSQPKKKKLYGLYSARVVGFIDGDSVKMVVNGKQTDVRLYGIDCPESGQAYGKVATAGIKELLAGRNIQIKIITHDRFGRAVAMVYADRKNVNEIMIKAGLAWVYRKYCKDDFCNDWLQLEKEAKLKNWRLWKDADPTPPWMWRKK